MVSGVMCLGRYDLGVAQMWKGSFKKKMFRVDHLGLSQTSDPKMNWFIIILPTERATLEGKPM